MSIDKKDRDCEKPINIFQQHGHFKTSYLLNGGTLHFFWEMGSLLKYEKALINCIKFPRVNSPGTSCFQADITYPPLKRNSFSFEKINAREWGKKRLFFRVFVVSFKGDLPGATFESQDDEPRIDMLLFRSVGSTRILTATRCQRGKF